MFLGTGLQIPAAAKHALQMSGSVTFGNLANGVSLNLFHNPILESIEWAVYLDLNVLI